AVDFADREITEITCHAVGAHSLFPKTKTIIDIGGQDTKVISLDEKGKVMDFIMNDKCAAGTGRFLEVMAHALETKIEELGELSLQSRNVLRISSMCTVFTESEVVSKIAEGAVREDIAAGIHKAIVDRILTMARKVGINEEITLTGGVSKNIGVVETIKSRVQKELNVPQDPQLTGALGAAILAQNYIKQKR
ncbi:MAG: 2-hydroxyglutaryl-CoA dehydratase, partial [Candidatus Omnitrophica bacterium]|nr:2-hydroxyglutaryl-CoA dehydratase [Candidatus Omnitrophota bacterium]